MCLDPTGYKVKIAFTTSPASETTAELSYVSPGVPQELQNMSRLRSALRQGEIPYDMRNGSGGFLGAERNLLKNRGLRRRDSGLWG